jgi:hypothetical protein
MDFKSKVNWRRVWWVILLLVGAYYFFSNYQRISMDPNAIDGVITLSLVILVFMPLVSEISAFGMSIKKEIQNTKNDLKKEVESIKNEIFNLGISNINNQQVHVYGNAPTHKEIEEIKSKLNEQERPDAKDTAEPKATSDLYEKYSVSDKQIFLYKTRYALEKKLEDITSKHGIKARADVRTGVTILRHRNIISVKTEDLITKVISICNRGIHGEVIDDEYIDYIKVVMTEISSDLDNEAIDKSPGMNGFTVCPRCHYAGAAYYDNECPKCGFVHDDN